MKMKLLVSQLQVEIHLKKNRIERPHHLEQIISKSVKEYEGEVFNEIFHSLTSETKAYLDGLLIMENNNSIMSWLKSLPQGISLKSILAESEKFHSLSQNLKTRIEKCLDNNKSYSE